MLREARRHHAFKILLGVPVLGPIRSAQIIASVGSPFRFRTKRQFWTYCGLAVVTRSSLITDSSKAVSNEVPKASPLAA